MAESPMKVVDVGEWSRNEKLTMMVCEVNSEHHI